MTEEKKFMDTIHEDFDKLGKLVHKAIHEASKWEQKEQDKLKNDIHTLMDKTGTSLTSVKIMEQKAKDAIQAEYKKLSSVVHNAIDNASEWEQDKKAKVSEDIHDGFNAIGTAFTNIKEKLQLDAKVSGDVIRGEEKIIHDGFVNTIQTIHHKISAHFNK